MRRHIADLKTKEQKNWNYCAINYFGRLKDIKKNFFLQNI